MAKSEAETESNKKKHMCCFITLSPSAIKWLELGSHFEGFLIKAPILSDQSETALPRGEFEIY